MKKYTDLTDEKSKCEQCAYFSTAPDDYPCSHCQHCHPDRFKPKEDKTT